MLLGSHQATIAKYPKLGGINNRNIFLTVLKAGKSKIQVLADLVSGWFIDGTVTLSSMARRGEGSLLGLFNPTREGSATMTSSHLPSHFPSSCSRHLGG